MDIKGICKYCKSTIFLIRGGVHHCKWVTNPYKKDSWHCDSDPHFPVRGHMVREGTVDVRYA